MVWGKQDIAVAADPDGASSDQMQRQDKNERRDGLSFAILWSVIGLLVATAASVVAVFLPCRFNLLRPCEAPPAYQTIFDSEANMKGVVSQNIEFYYVTNRPYVGTASDENPTLEELFGADPQQYEAVTLGRGEARVPFKLPDDAAGNRPQNCTSIEINPGAANIAKRIKCEFDNKKYRGLSLSGEWVKSDGPERVDAEAKLRKVEEQGEIVRLRRLIAVSDNSGVKKYRRFAEDIQAAMKNATGAGGGGFSVLIYVHGFDTPFEESVRTAADLVADLTMWANSNPSTARQMALGPIIAFSWPTWKLLDGTSTENIRLDDTKNLNYFESQLRADASASAFGRLLEIIAAETDVDTINIVAHSMGNRIALAEIQKLARTTVNRRGGPVSIHLVSAGADVGRAEFEKALEGTNQAGGFRTTVYFSNEDGALSHSSELQSKKRQFIKDVRDGDDTAKSPNAGSYEDVRRRRRLSIDRLLKLTGRSDEDWFGEDSCRLGRLEPPGSGTTCGGMFERIPLLEAVDATKFNTDKILANVFGAGGHSYFQNAPMALSDISCALRGMSAADARRSTARSPSEGNKDSPRNWVLMPPDTSKAGALAVDPYCKSTGRTYLYESIRESHDPDPVTVYFDVESAIPCAAPVDNDEEGNPPLSDPCAAAGDGMPLIQDLASRLKSASDDSGLRAKIEGFADASDRTTDKSFDNCGLSTRRAEAAKALFERAIREVGLEVAEIATAGRCATQESPARNKLARKAEISVSFEDP